jgi:hypothetical protein
LAAAEEDTAGAKLQYHRLQAELSAWKVIAVLMAAQGD